MWIKQMETLSPVHNKMSQPQRELALSFPVEPHVNRIDPILFNDSLCSFSNEPKTIGQFLF